MNATSKKPGRPPREPSGRNLDLYYELVCENRFQTVVAARFRITQPRVARIRHEVAAWIELILATAPASTQELLTSKCKDTATRFHIAIAVRRLQLLQAYGQYLSAFGGPSGVTAFGHLQAVKDARLLPSELKKRLPPRAFIATALRMARELDDLARLSRRGPVANLPETLLAAHHPPPSSYNDNSQPIALILLLSSPHSATLPAPTTDASTD